MAELDETALFREKWLKLIDEFRLRRVQFAGPLQVSPAQVSRLLSGDRAFHRDDIGPNVVRRGEQLGRALVHLIGEDELRRSVQAALRQAPEATRQQILTPEFGQRRLKLWQVAERCLFNDAVPLLLRVPETLAPAQPPPPLLGMAGLMTALAWLERRAQDIQANWPEAALTVYLSSDETVLLDHPDADQVWQRLYAINGERAVPLVIEQDAAGERPAVVVERLLPHIQTGRVELHHVPSTEQYLCYNVTILLADRCLVMTTEPAGRTGASVSMCVESPDFVHSIAQTLRALRGHKAKALAEPVRSGRRETQLLAALHDGFGSLSARYDGVNLLFAGPDSFARLLARCDEVSDGQRRWAMARFTRQKQAFEVYMERNPVLAIVSLEVVDRLLADLADDPDGAAAVIPELAFPVSRPVVLGRDLVRDLLAGMVAYRTRFRRFQLILCHTPRRLDMMWQIQGGRRLLLHDFEDGHRHCLYSEEDLLIGRYKARWQEAYAQPDTLRGRREVIEALNARIATLDRLGPLTVPAATPDPRDAPTDPAATPDPHATPTNPAATPDSRDASSDLAATPAPHDAPTNPAAAPDGRSDAAPPPPPSAGASPFSPADRPPAGGPADRGDTP